MKKNARTIILVGLLAIGIILLFALNKIVYSTVIEEDMRLEKVDFEQFSRLPMAYGKISEYEYSSGLKEMFSASGWAFADSTGEAGSEKEIRLLFKGKSVSYLSKPCGLVPDGLQTEFAGWKVLPSSDNHFMANFSTIIMASGEYDVYIFVSENDQESGLVDTGIRYQKKGILFENILTLEETTIECDDLDSTVTNGWINLTEEKDYLEVSGWAYVENVVSEKATFYIVVQGENGESIVVKAKNQFRGDVPSMLENWDYVGCSLDQRIGCNYLPDEVGDVYVVIEYNGIYYKNTPDHYDLTETE